MNYQGIPLQKEFQIEELFSLHYFEYMSTFSFPGETHDFWEFVCVDKGEVTIGADNHTYVLRKGEIAFHEPNEFHWVKANGNIAPNLIVISFSCTSLCMDFFRKKIPSGRFKGSLFLKKILQVDDLERGILARLIAEAGEFLKGRLDDPYQTVLERNPSASTMSGQLIQLYLEQLLINLYRRYTVLSKPASSFQSLENTVRENTDTEIFAQVTNYLSQNLNSRVTIEKICHDNLIGRSQLQKIFQRKTGLGIIEYFSRMKIDTAKQLIRSEQMNFTQISEKLGYASIHYFSRQFKKVTGMTPSEYASSIKAIADRKQERFFDSPHL